MDDMIVTKVNVEQESFYLLKKIYQGRDSQGRLCRKAVNVV